LTELQEVTNEVLKLVTPTCCDRAKYSGAIFIDCENLKPFWAARGWHAVYMGTMRESVEFCPFCGSKLPEIVPSRTKKKVYKIKYDGDYCGTCKKRSCECQCLPPAFRWKPKESDHGKV
jgi:hypothetical protein